MTSAAEPPLVLGGYVLFDQVASGGMATVHLGRRFDSEWPASVVAIKRMHPQLLGDPSFVAMFIDEARLAGRIQHPNVVVAKDVAQTDDELLLVMDYVAGQTLSSLLQVVPVGGVAGALASAVMGDVLSGLHAAHQAHGSDGKPLYIVHRDVSPSNVMVGLDGRSHVLDFGIAKARGRLQRTNAGIVKGKLSYMAPEQLLAQPLDRRTDVYACAVVLWELLTGRKLFAGQTTRELVQRYDAPPAPPSEYAPAVDGELDAVVLRGLNAAPERRYADAAEMAAALRRACPPATHIQVAQWLVALAGPQLQRLAARVERVERTPLGAAAAKRTGAPAASSLAEAMGRVLRSEAATDVEVTPPQGQVAAGEETTTTTQLALRQAQDEPPTRRWRGDEATTATHQLARAAGGAGEGTAPMSKLPPSLLRAAAGAVVAAAAEQQLSEQERHSATATEQPTAASTAAPPLRAPARGGGWALWLVLVAALLGVIWLLVR